MQSLKATIRSSLLPTVGRWRPTEWGLLDDTVLIIQPDHLGDILLSQPAVRAIREQHPGSRLVAIVGPWSREVVTIAWDVDEIVTIDFPGFTRQAVASPVAPYRLLIGEARRLREQRSHTAYALRPDGWWAAWLASLAAPNVRTSNDPAVQPFSTSTVATIDGEHAVQRSWRIAVESEAVVNPVPNTHPISIPISASAAADARELLHHHHLTGKYVVIHPGSGAPVKEWPQYRWTAVARSLSAYGYHLVLTGGSAETDQCSAIADAVDGAISLAGATSVAVLSEVLRGASLALGPDCGPLHLATAVDTPTIHLFGPSDPGRYGPWGDPRRHRILSANWRCARCGDLSMTRAAGCGCMLAIQIDDVLDSARVMLSVHGN